MAILDKKLEMLDATSCVYNATSALEIGDVLDLGLGKDAWDQSITPDIGEAGDLWVNVRVATAFGTGTTATLDLYTHTTATVESGTKLITASIAASSAAGKSIIRQKVPAGTISRYLGFYLTVGASAVTAGALDGWIGLDSESELPTT